MHLYDRLRNAVATTKKSLLKRRDDAVSYAKTLPTRAKIRAAGTTSRLGDSLVDLAAKLHEATTETKRQQWRRRIREWRQQVRIEELMLGDARTSAGGRVVVKGKGDAKVAHFVGNNGGRINLDRFFVTPKAVEVVAEETGIDAAAIVAKLGKSN
jgi:hypothetical protein